jgi:hypothetical protein
MPTLQELIPDVDVLVALAPEELGWYLLRVAKSQLQHGIFAPSNLTLVTSGSGMAAHQHSPYGAREDEVELAAAEAWNWLRVQGLIVPAPGINGTHGFYVISRRGAALTTDNDFQRFRAAAAFPKSMLHSAIADKVWIALARGDLADAVFIAYRSVEEAGAKSR